jgi:small subunit ribosomal protein S17
MKQMIGEVRSAKTANTVSVRVDRKWKHPLYKKYVKRSKTYACHVEGMTLAVGDHVTIAECRPLSKTKHFKVVRKNESTTV